jgi:hypothetical protein
MAVAKGPYIHSGALLPRHMADALLVGPWVSGHLSTLLSGCWAYSTVSDRVSHLVKSFVRRDTKRLVVQWQMSGEVAY